VQDMNYAIRKPMFPIPGLTILGTDTEVGKTYVACRVIESLVCEGVRVGVYKPVASGAPTREMSDGFQLWQASGQRRSLDEVNPQHFLAPLAPPMAAELEGRQVSDAMILDGARRWAEHCDLLVVEGAGGLLSPISWTMTNATLAQALKFPVVLISEIRLGVVNQVLTTLTAARALDLSVAAIVLNDLRNVGELASSAHLRLLQAFLNEVPNAPPLTVLGCNDRAFAPRLLWSELAG
jgi:dethiobiotin synthetase